MNPTESQIENLLRHAPRPAAPAGLKDKLVGQIRFPANAPRTSQQIDARRASSWWQRWWPALAPATAALAGAVVIVVQHSEITQLKTSIRDLNSILSTATNAAPANAQKVEPTISTPALETDAEEITRLKQRAATLTTEIGQLEAVQKANDSLRTQLATPAGFSQQELDALAEAKERAQSIACVNNLKQVGLAVRIWASDNNDINPLDFLSMSNELVTPKILFCPGNTNLTPAKTWAEMAGMSSSYEYLAAGATNSDVEPMRILLRCPIHNNLGLCDGSVQRVSRQHPEFIVERDGKLYLDMSARPANPISNP